MPDVSGGSWPTEIGVDRPPDNDKICNCSKFPLKIYNTIISAQNKSLFVLKKPLSAFSAQKPGIYVLLQQRAWPVL